MTSTRADHGPDRSRQRLAAGRPPAIMRLSCLCRRLFALALLGAALDWHPTSQALAQSLAEPVMLPGQIGARLSKCWRPPKPEPPQPIEVTVRVRFSAAGALIGEPRVAYTHASLR